MFKKASYTLEKSFKKLPIYNPSAQLVIQPKLRQKLVNFISTIWETENSEEIYLALLKIMKEAYKRKPPRLVKRDKNFNLSDFFSEKDLYLICYGNHLLDKTKNKSSLRVLGEFIINHFNPKTFPELTVHLLPFYSSPFKDRGFDVADPFKVNQKMGSWEDIDFMAKNFNLAFDFVANHLSKDSVWFKKFLAGDSKFADFFIAFDENSPADMAQLKNIRKKYQKLIYRPRAHDPFIRVKRKDGSDVWVYMTFSDHQPDVNYANPKVFLKMVEVYLYYILKGATTLRLDAIPYLWKEWGTSCVHHPKTHTLLEFFRAIADLIAPSTRLLAESMEPPQDSARYLSSRKVKKAHMVYNFLLCGLIPHAFFQGDVSKLQEVLTYFEVPSEHVAQAVVCGKTHDGSSVNPCRAPKSVEGKAVLTEKEINQLANIYTRKGLIEMKNRAGPNFAEQFTKKHGQPPCFVNYKTIVDNQGMSQKIVYEIISTYASLFENNADNIVAALALGLPIKGVPFVYLTAIFAVLNDYQWYFQGGNPRQLNEGSLFIDELKKFLIDESSLSCQVFGRMRTLFKVRSSHPAFHPNGFQKAVFTGNKAVFSLLRISPDKKEKILVLHNVTDVPQEVRIDLLKIDVKTKTLLEIISEDKYKVGSSSHMSFNLEAYQILWLKINS